MRLSRKEYQERGRVEVQLRLQANSDPAIDSYIASLKKKYKRYAMPLDEARKIIDAAMGDKTLTEALYETRGQAD